jgi:protein TonB
MIMDPVPDLTDLAFEGRNKEYGAYRLRKRYNRYVVISLLIGVIAFLTLVLVPLFYYLMDPVELQDDDFLYTLEYSEMEMPPVEDFSKYVQTLSQPEEKPQQAPVVTDSAILEQEKPKEEPENKPTEEISNTDTVSQPGGSGLGEGSEDDSGLALSADVRPEFPGGDYARLRFLSNNIRYPEEAIRKKIQGVVMVSLIVEKDGGISNIRIVNGIGGGCDEEAVRVVNSMPKWIPAKRNGKPVRIILKMPVVFRIPGAPK